MKRSFTFLIAAVALMIATLGSGAEAWGQTTISGTWRECSFASIPNGATVAIISSTNYALPSTTCTSGSPAKVGVTIEGTTGNYTITPASGTLNNLAWTINNSSSSAVKFLQYGSSDVYLRLSGTNSNTALRVGNTNSNNTFVMGSAGKLLKYSEASRYVGPYASGSDWRTYNSETATNYDGASLKFYVLNMTYSITYNCNGAETGCPDPNVLQNQTAIPNPLPTGLTKTHYTFDGWFTNEECTIAAVAGANISENTTLYAKWNPEEYTITYQAGEGSGESQEDTKYYGINYEILGNDITEFTAPVSKPNFNGWLGSDEQTYAAGDIYSTNASLTLTAQWTASDLFDVVYDCNGGIENCPTDNSYEMGTVINLPAAPTYAGHTFNGWLDDAEPAVNHAAGSSYTVTGDVYFTAQWLENLTAPTFNVTGVSTGAANTYYATASVEISQSQEATIYYTTNGDTPTTSSSVYEEAIVINTTGTTVVKALAVKSGYVDSPIAEQTIIIVQPNVAEFTNGVYSETFESSLGLWSAFNIAGTNVWSQGTVTVYSVDYKGANINGYQASDHDWLVSPKMVAENGKLVIDFETAARYKLTSGNEGYKLAVKYSTDYVGYGNPTTYTWTALNPTVATPTSSSIVTAESGDVVISGLANNAEVYVAFIYTSGSSSGQATQYIISNFEAKQCYPVNYDANGGEGEMEDEDSPYAVGAEVTVMPNGFTAPTGTAFEKWNTQADGSGTDYMPAATFNMGTSAVTLYAQWSEPCTVTATMAATTAEYEYVSTGDNPSYNINLGSSVSALGGCDIYEYGYVYSPTETTPTLENATKIQVGTTYETAETPFEATAIENATLGETYYVCSFATNNAGTAYSAVAQIAMPAAYPTYTINYLTNGVAETPATIFQGYDLTALAAPTQAYIPTGFNFAGWTKSENDMVIETTPVEISGNTTLYAVFSIEEQDYGENIAIVDGSTLTATATSEESTQVIDGISYKFSAGAKKQAVENTAENYLKEGFTVLIGRSGAYIHNDNPFGDKITGFEIYANKGASTKVSVGVYFSANVITEYAEDDENTWTATLSTVDHVYDASSALPAGAKYFWYQVTNANNSQIQFRITYNGPKTVTHYYTRVIPSGNATADITIAGPTILTSGSTLNMGEYTLTNTNPANLVIEDGAQLIHSNAGVAATVKKSITGYNGGSGNYYLIAAPMVSAVSTSGIAIGTYDLYAYDEVQALWLNAKQEGSTFNTLNPQQGYLYANNATQEVSMAGTLNPSNEAMSYNLSYARDEEDNFKGFNLVGNPFACNASVNGSNSNAFYKMNEDGTEVEVVINPVVAPCTGIFALATDESQTVTFTKNTTGEPNVTRGLLTIAISKAEGRANKQVDRAIVSFDEINALPKFNINAGNSKLYIPQGSKNYAVVNAEAEGSLPLCFEANQRGNYTISVNTENLNVEYLHLIDNMTGADIDLLVEGSYSFKSNRNDYASRFKLVFKANAQNDEMNEVESSFAYISNGELIVSNEGRATLQVIDMMGRVLRSQSINGDCRISVNGMTAGVYVLNLNGKTQKIVVR